MNTRQIAIAVLSGAALILVLVWMYGGFHSRIPAGNVPSAQRPGERPKTVKAEVLDTTGEVTVSGTVGSRDIARVASRIMGTIAEIRADAGDRVSKGQLLVRIDAKDLADREAQARAALESAKADLLKARADFDRYKPLFEKQSISKKDLDDAQARLDVAQAAHQRAQSALEETATLLSYGQIAAPFDGIVAERSANLGDLAVPGRLLIAVYRPDQLELVAAAGEQYAAYLKEGLPVRVEVPSIKLNERSAIREVVPQRDEKTRTITVKAPLAETAGLVPGLYGTLTFGTQTSRTVALPRAAIRIIGQLEDVRVLDQGTVSVRHVKTGRSLPDDKVEILSGLRGGEDVVVDQGHAGDSK